MKGLLIAAGNPPDKELLKEMASKADMVVCADGGLKYTLDSGVEPDIVMGDFDSLPEEYLGKINPEVEVKKFSPEKDFTDMEIALKKMCDRGCTDITILGAIGTRMDHVLGNFFTLIEVHKNGATGRILDSHNEVEYLTLGETKVNKAGFKYISILPIEETMFSTKGFKYEVKALTIKPGTTIGISNELVEEEGEIEIHKGSCFVIKSKD